MEEDERENKNEQQQEEEEEEEEELLVDILPPPDENSIPFLCSPRSQQGPPFPRPSLDLPGSRLPWPPSPPSDGTDSSSLPPACRTPSPRTPRPSSSLDLPLAPFIAPPPVSLSLPSATPALSPSPTRPPCCPSPPPQQHLQQHAPLPSTPPHSKPVPFARQLSPPLRTAQQHLQFVFFELPEFLSLRNLLRRRLLGTDASSSPSWNNGALTVDSHSMTEIVSCQAALLETARPWLKRHGTKDGTGAPNREKGEQVVTKQGARAKGLMEQEEQGVELPPLLVETIEIRDIPEGDEGASGDVVEEGLIETPLDVAVTKVEKAGHGLSLSTPTAPDHTSLPVSLPSPPANSLPPHPPFSTPAPTPPEPEVQARQRAREGRWELLPVPEILRQKDYEARKWAVHGRLEELKTVLRAARGRAHVDSSAAARPMDELSQIRRLGVRKKYHDMLQIGVGSEPGQQWLADIHLAYITERGCTGGAAGSQQWEGFGSAGAGIAAWVAHVCKYPHAHSPAAHRAASRAASMFGGVGTVEYGLEQHFRSYGDSPPLHLIPGGREEEEEGVVAEWREEVEGMGEFRRWKHFALLMLSHGERKLHEEEEVEKEVEEEIARHGWRVREMAIHFYCNMKPAQGRTVGRRLGLAQEEVEELVEGYALAEKVVRRYLAQELHPKFQSDL